MDPKALLTHLSQVCDDMDARRPLRRPAFALPAASLLLMGVAVSAGCDEAEPAYMAPSDTAYSAPMDEICDNGEDDDGDELSDCADPDCEDDPTCANVPAYMAPME